MSIPSNINNDPYTAHLRPSLELFSSKYLERFKVHNPKTLFPPTQKEFVKSIQEGKCPICLRKIYWKKDLSLGFCRSKVKDGFVIGRKAYSKLGGR